jgi:TolB-like protein
MGAETPNQVDTAVGAVFLSYASQDADAARRICDALRAAGVEVWFDQSELRGGDAWDQAIRRQIKTCALFIPVISRHTHDRDEGYFRLEWKLAVDRSHLISANRAFLLPVVVDDMRDDDENVPDRFREVQWTRLSAGETPSTFVKRVQRLLSPGAGTPATPSAPTTGAMSGAVPATSGRASQLWRTRRVLLLVMATIVAGSLGYMVFERLVRSKPGVQATTANSIAVLPLANESGDASQTYFSDGLSEDLITTLSQFPGLKVIGRTSSFQFRDSKDDSKSIGAKLGVAHLLEGSVRHAGDVVRVSVELIDTADGSTQWSERYDRPYKDLFALQDDITQAVAGALKAHLVPSENASAQSDRPPSGNMEAYNAVLKASSTMRARPKPTFARQLSASLSRQSSIHTMGQLGVTYRGHGDSSGGTILIPGRRAKRTRKLGPRPKQQLRWHPTLRFHTLYELKSSSPISTGAVPKRNFVAPWR